MSRLRFIDVEQAVDPISRRCRVLAVTRAGSDAWARRGVALRAQADTALTTEMRAASRATSGAPRIHADRRARGIRVGRKRVARRLRAAGLVGWAMAEHLRTARALAALLLALAARRPVARTVVHHPDRGCPSTADRSQVVRAAQGITGALSRPGTCRDNAMAERCCGTRKAELVDRYRWPTRRVARSAIVAWIAVFDHWQRRHATLGDLSPAAFADRQAEKVAAEQRGVCRTGATSGRRLPAIVRTDERWPGPIPVVRVANHRDRL